MKRQHKSSKSYRPRPSSKTRFWYIGKRNKNNEIIGLLFVGALLVYGIWNSLSASGQALLVILLILLVAALFGVTFAFVAVIRHRRRQQMRVLSAAQVDRMDGLQFEHYIAALLESQGFTHIQVTPPSGDYGADVIAHKDRERWAVQVKCFRKPVGNRAVNEVVGSKNYYQAHRTMVVTNSHFTPNARIAAFVNNTTLVDREKLAQWITAFQKS